MPDDPRSQDIRAQIADLDRRIIRLEEQQRYQTHWLEQRLGHGGVADQVHREIWKRINEISAELYGEGRESGIKERLNDVVNECGYRRKVEDSIWNRIKEISNELYGEGKQTGLKERLNKLFEDIEYTRKMIMIWLIALAVLIAIVSALILPTLFQTEEKRFQLELLEPSKPLIPR